MLKAHPGCVLPEGRTRDHEGQAVALCPGGAARLSDALPRCAAGPLISQDRERCCVPPSPHPTRATLAAGRRSSSALVRGTCWGKTLCFWVSTSQSCEELPVNLTFCDVVRTQPPRAAPRTAQRTGSARALATLRGAGPGARRGRSPYSEVRYLLLILTWMASSVRRGPGRAPDAGRRGVGCAAATGAAWYAAGVHPDLPKHRLSLAWKRRRPSLETSDLRPGAVKRPVRAPPSLRDCGEIQLSSPSLSGSCARDHTILALPKHGDVTGVGPGLTHTSLAVSRAGQASCVPGRDGTECRPHLPGVDRRNCV